MTNSEGVAVLYSYFEQSRDMLKLLAAEFVENSDAALDAALSNLDAVSYTHLRAHETLRYRG